MNASPRASRRDVLRGFAVAPIAASAGVVSPWSEALAALHRAHDDEPASLCRSEHGRRLSRARYHRAASFFRGIEAGIPLGLPQLLYHAGIVAQLALSAHLLDIGFDDRWCARHIGLRVAKALAYTNATGFGHECPDMGRLAAVLTPYWKWNAPRLFGEPAPDYGGFTADQVGPLLLAVLERVRQVTGHPRPKGGRRHVERREDGA